MTSPDPNQARRLELILQQLDALPTLPAVAVRLLQVTSDEDADARQVMELVSADPSLTAKVLAMCRGADRGIRQPVTTVDRAVVLLGFKAVRNAVLSIKVFEVFGEAERGAPDAAAPPAHRFDHVSFWRHALAVGIAAELIAERHGLNGAEAFVCGLMHDLGKLALEHVLPRSYERVVELADLHQMNIADVERRVIGIDHHTVGKRLAEHWQLPHIIQDCIWLHGSPHHMIPELPHRQMVGLIGVADVLARRQHLGYSGNYQFTEEVPALCRHVGLDPAKVQDVVETLHEELSRRAQVMGLGQTPSRQMLLESVMQANAVLGRLNAQLTTRRKQAIGQARVLDSIVRFHQHSTTPGRTVQDLLSLVASSAASCFGEGYYATLYQGAAQGPWLLSRYATDGRLLASDYIEPPQGAAALSQFAPAGPTVAMPIAGPLAFLAPHLPDHLAMTDVHALPLPCGWGAAAIMLLDRPQIPTGPPLEALVHTWGAAIAAATQHQGARRLGEQLAEANRLVAEAQQTLLRQQSMARLGEMAAGAAHEMNNPLAVISGRAQLLAMQLPKGSKQQQDADVIWKQADRLSDLITALRLFADPPRPKMSYATPVDILESAIHLTRQRCPDAKATKVAGIEAVGALWTDPQHVATAIAELLINAHEAQPKTAVCLSASVDQAAGRFILKVVDDGMGMDAATLEHAFDPFFSAKPAGRQPGLGLSRAQRLIEGLGGSIELRSQAGRGATATLALPMAAGNTRAKADPESRSQGEVRAFKQATRPQ